MSDDFRRLGPTSLADLLAPSIRDDATVAAITAALDPMLQNAVRSIPNLLLWARLTPDAAYLSAPMQRLAAFAGGLKPLSDEELELLAWQEHVDFWRPDWPRRVREDLVRNSTRWHRLKGTPAGLRMALELFGHRVAIEERTPGLHWATYQLGIDDIPDIETVREIWDIAHEMHPARCKLWRMYNPEYDRRPTVWGVGPGWSCGYYSRYSGVAVPEVDDGLIVSFGSRRSFQTEAYNPSIASGLTRTVAALIPYVNRPIWGRSAYSAVFPKRHGFIVSELFSFHFATCEVISWEWEGEWDERPWVLITDWDRVLPKWQKHVRQMPRSRSCWGEGGKPWSDVNSRYGGNEVKTLTEKPVYGKSSYSRSPLRLTRQLNEFFIEKHAARAIPVTGPDSGTGAQLAAVMADMTAASTAPLRETTWDGEWDDRRWDNYVAYVGITQTTEDDYVVSNPD